MQSYLGRLWFASSHRLICTWARVAQHCPFLLTTFFVATSPIKNSSSTHWLHLATQHWKETLTIPSLEHGNGVYILTIHSSVFLSNSQSYPLKYINHITFLSSILMSILTFDQWLCPHQDTTWFYLLIVSHTYNFAHHLFMLFNYMKSWLNPKYGK